MSKSSQRSSGVPSLEDGVAPDPYGLISGIDNHSAGTGGHPVTNSPRKKPKILIENDSPLENGAQLLAKRNNLSKKSNKKS